MIHEKLNLRSH